MLHVRITTFNIEEGFDSVEEFEVNSFAKALLAVRRADSLLGMDGVAQLEVRPHMQRWKEIPREVWAPP